MKKLSLVILTIFLAGLHCFAQDAPLIDFKTTEWDFGTFREEAGPQKHRFEFTNKGKGALKVSNVQASCGCTTPGWSKEEVKPGQTGYVEAEYNPQGRPGTFEKTLTVSTNAVGQEQVVLHIKGFVTEHVKTASEIYPRKFGKVRLVSEYLNLGRVSPDKEGKQTFKIYNDYDKEITFAPLVSTAKHFKAEISPLKIGPTQTADITITYDTKIKNDWGYANDPIDLTVTDSATHAVKLYVIATIEQEPKKLDEKDALKGPRMKFTSDMEHSFGELKAGDIVNYEFQFTNVGKEPLKIFKSKASCGCTASEPSKTTLAPGEAGNIKVTFNTTGKHPGDQQQSVTLYTNDPVEPTRFLTIKAKIPEAPKPGESAAPAASPATGDAGAAPVNKANKRLKVGNQANSEVPAAPREQLMAAPAQGVAAPLKADESTTEPAAATPAKGAKKKKK